MINQQELCRFLVEAKQSTYAAGDAAKSTKEPDGSTTLIYQTGDWKYHDNYFGGEPYGGREVVFYQGKPVYIMVYYGWVEASVTDAGSIYKVLQGALSKIPEEKPYRGPSKLVHNNLIYTNRSVGEVDNFSGEEFIKSSEGKLLYQARYIGGLIDQR